MTATTRTCHIILSQKRQKHNKDPSGFDGLAKSKYGPSLNQVLETGPNLNPDLLSTTMRFQMNRYAWIADIEKAFLNIALQPADVEAIRFLWSTEPSKLAPS